MHLGDARNGTLYCTSGLNSVVLNPATGTEVRSRFPDPPGVSKCARFRALHSTVGKSILSSVTGRYQSSNVWALSEGSLLANVGPRVYRSADGGRSWAHVLDLPASSPPKGLLPSSVCRHDGDVYLAEYALSDEPGRIRVSDDDGRTWSVFLERDDVRHFHGVYADPYGETLWANTGDADDESSLGIVTDGEYEPLGSGSQAWRGVQLGFTPEAVFWGKDASFAAEKPIYKLPRERLSDSNPDPDVVGTTDGVLFYVETFEYAGDHYVVGSASSQTGIDSTAPSDRRRNTCPREVRVVAASSADGYESWHELCSVERRRTLGDALPGIPTTDAHAFLRVDSELGLLVNPYNTSTHDGRVLRMPLSRVAEVVAPGSTSAPLRRFSSIQNAARRFLS
ncbi:glycosyl hydrolase BNR repeat-containing protein [Halogeometricum pallidum JCM 14848]|uniref:Glycosyl hydrolase BNR repeat-containing protein n=1 Tax=Halogeometricum pallidum JCM 14848 TaxID=1227487 RepID=M0D835_HALPD|nr:sialidase family protein [Halogeometricum pallidum]ELZ31660.1 glycosyl hydrolase BNR repeat-containing protein [Halogeometricum pallidum JCM 14848]